MTVEFCGMKREIDRKCLNHARVHANAQSFDRCEVQNKVNVGLMSQSQKECKQLSFFARLEISWVKMQCLLSETFLLGKELNNIFCIRVFII